MATIKKVMDTKDIQVLNMEKRRKKKKYTRA
jgi:hypothetical protein